MTDLDVRLAVLVRAGDRCELCGNDYDIHLHHRYKPGRVDTFENLVALCAHCHLHEVHANPRWAYGNGLLVHSWDGLPTEVWK